VLSMYVDVTVLTLLQWAAITWTGLFLGVTMMVPNDMMTNDGSFQAIVSASTWLILCVSLVVGGFFGCFINQQWVSLLPRIVTKLLALFVAPSVSTIIQKIMMIGQLDVSGKEGMIPTVVASFLSVVSNILLGYWVDCLAWYIGPMTLVIMVLNHGF
jgi:hypothetical protein